MARKKRAKPPRDTPRGELDRLRLQVSRDPEDVEALYAWFDALSAHAGSQSALAALRALAERPGASSPSLVLGYCLFGLGRNREGVVAFERAHKRRPREPTLYGYASALLVTGNPQQALAVLEAADRRGKLTTRPLVCLANTYLALGRLRLAEKTLRRVSPRGEADWRELVESARAQVRLAQPRSSRLSKVGAGRRAARAREAGRGDEWLRAAADGGVLLRVHAQPGAARSRVGAVDPWRHALVVQVRARAEAGEANAELCRTLADTLGVAPSAVSIARGTRSREKLVRIQGVDVSRARPALEAAP